MVRSDAEPLLAYIWAVTALINYWSTSHISLIEVCDSRSRLSAVQASGQGLELC